MLVINVNRTGFVISWIRRSDGFRADFKSNDSVLLAENVIVLLVVLDVEFQVVVDEDVFTINNTKLVSVFVLGDIV